MAARFERFSLEGHGLAAGTTADIGSGRQPKCIPVFNFIVFASFIPFFTLPQDFLQNFYRFQVAKIADMIHKELFVSLQ